MAFAQPLRQGKGCQKSVKNDLKRQKNGSSPYTFACPALKQFMLSLRISAHFS
jgi:hypothetical protein